GQQQAGQSSRQYLLQSGVIEQWQAKQYSLEIEPVVIAREKEAILQQKDAEGCEEPQSARKEDQERYDQLDEKCAASGEFQQARWQMRHVPSRRRGQRLREKVIGQRRQVPPVGITAQQLDHAGHKQEAGQQPAQQPDARRRSEAQQQRQKPGLKQVDVPLLGHELLPAVKQREIEHVKEREAKARHHIEDQ